MNNPSVINFLLKHKISKFTQGDWLAQLVIKALKVFVVPNFSPTVYLPISIYIYSLLCQLWYILFKARYFNICQNSKVSEWRMKKGWSPVPQPLYWVEHHWPGSRNPKTKQISHTIILSKSMIISITDSKTKTTLDDWNVIKKNGAKPVGERDNRIW